MGWKEARKAFDEEITSSEKSRGGVGGGEGRQRNATQIQTKREHKLMS